MFNSIIERNEQPSPKKGGVLCILAEGAGLS